MPNYITTSSGIHFDPVHPDPELISIKDIAHALSQTCRGNGHVSEFFSVGQHCINCCLEAKARGYSERVVLACLLHDASESYMSDVPRPFKQYITSYLELEDKLLSVIYEKFLGSDISEEEARQVKEVDDAMLWYDLKYLLNEDGQVAKQDVHIDIDYTFVPFKQVEDRYIELFHENRIV